MGDGEIIDKIDRVILALVDLRNSLKPTNELPTNSKLKIQDAITTYYEAYEKKYKIKIVFTAKDIGILTRLGKSIGIKKLCDLIEVYLQSDDKWYEIRHHDLVTFEQNLTRLQVALGSGLRTIDRQRKDEAAAFLAAVEGKANDSRKLPKPNEPT